MAAALKAGDGATADQAVVDVVQASASAEAAETAPANVAAAPQGTAAKLNLTNLDGHLSFWIV